MRRYVAYCIVGLLALSSSWACVPKKDINFGRSKPVKYTEIVSVPDEAVIYMQNLALMRDRVEIGEVEHVELVLPPRIIVESLQLRVGERHIDEFNVETGRYTLVRVRNVGKYLQGGKPLVLEYLTWGIYWSAQYRIDLENNEMRVQLGALITNRWYDLAGLEVTLVAGWVGVSPELTRSGSSHRSREPAKHGTVFFRAKRLASHLPGVLASKRRRAMPGGARLADRLLAQAGSHQTPSVKNSYGKPGRVQTRAFEADLLRKYNIRRVDATARNRRSNYEKQFSGYYRGPARRLLGVALRNEISGYALYPGMKVNLKENEKSYVRMAGWSLQVEPYYVWPADRGERAFKIYEVENKTGQLLPAGDAWIYRKSVFVGQDLFRWTPQTSSALLTTPNDGMVTVRKRRAVLEDGTFRSRLTVRNLSDREVTVEVFDQNPSYQSPVETEASIQPENQGEKGPYLRWRLDVAAKSKSTVEVSYRPQRSREQKSPTRQPMSAPAGAEGPARRRRPARRRKPTGRRRPAGGKQPAGGK
jgi:hypothetical protein